MLALRSLFRSEISQPNGKLILFQALTGHTAAEITHLRADSGKKNMGLTNWRGAKIRKNDTEIAKNYLKEDELAALNNLVEQYLIFAQGQALRRVPMHMKDWIKKLDGFMRINERDILSHAGKISHKLALDKVDKEYKKYAQKRQLDYDKKGNDFDSMVEETKKLTRKKSGKKKDVKNGERF